MTVVSQNIMNNKHRQDLFLYLFLFWLSSLLEPLLHVALLISLIEKQSIYKQARL